MVSTRGGIAFRSADDEIPHPLAIAPGLGQSVQGSAGSFRQSARNSASGPASGPGSVSTDQIVARYLGLSLALAGELVQSGLRLAELLAVLVTPGRQEVIGVIDLMPPVEVDDPPDAVLVAVGVGDRGMGSEGRIRPACRTRWSATSRAAARYFLTRAGDMASDSPELSNPASFAGSTGNSRVGRMSTPVRSRIV